MTGAWDFVGSSPECATANALSFPLNLGRVGNAFALFLGVEPADIFLYVFLPPILFDAAVRIDYYVFKKMIVHVISFAFLVVIASTAMFVPILLYVLGLKDLGWTWQHAALFSAMIASTDAVAVSAILKKGGAPEKLIVLMEGESLFNDATSIVLFEIFFRMVKRMQNGKTASDLGFFEQMLEIASSICWLAFGGVVLGLAFGVLTRLVLRLMHRRGHKAPEQLALIVGMAYLSFYVANGPCGVSGVIAVVVFGLYGSATGKWHMSPRVVESGAFEIFWDTVVFAFNGLIFFFAGASSINFFWRSSTELFEDEGNLAVLFKIFWRLPLIFIATIIVRGVTIALFNPLFKLAKSEMTMSEILFATIGGLRGAVSLILTQVVVTEQNPDPTLANRAVTAELALWTAGIVVCTLVVNAPLMPLILRWTRLSDISPVKVRMRGKAARALLRYTRTAIEDLQHDEDEMLRGVDWTSVETFVDLHGKLDHFAQISPSNAEKQKAQDKALAKTAHWINGSSSAVGDAQGPRHSSGDEEQPLLSRLSVDEEMGLATRATLATLEEGENEGGDGEDSGASAELPPAELAAARQCAANLLRANTVIGAAEGNKEMKDRHQGFGAYDVPFLGPSRQNQEKEAEQEDAEHVIDMNDDESEPEVLDLENPAFDIRLADELPAQPPKMDLVDRLEFEEDAAASNVPSSRLSQASQASQGTADATLQRELLEQQPSPFQRFASQSSIDSMATIPSTTAQQPVQALPAPSPFQDVLLSTLSGRESLQRKHRSTVIPQPIIVPKMVRPGDAREGEGERPSMRWVSMVGSGHAEGQQPQQPKGRTIVRQDPNVAVGVSFSFTDTSAPTPGGNRRTLTSRKKRAETKALHRVLSSPLMHNPPDVNNPEDNEDIEDDLDEDDPEVLAEARVRLVAGLKRYFHEKRGQGLLSGRGIVELDHACDAAMDRSSQPLSIWKVVERDVCGRGTVRWLSRSLFSLRRLTIMAGNWGPRFLVRPCLIAPATWLAELLGRQLSGVMLLSIEVAVEYWLALTWSPQAQWLNELAKSGVIQDEVKSESKKVWRFIIEREIEAPARFQAIQTHRAAMAILRQQGLFVEQLYHSGMVDEVEKELLSEPIQKNERRLMRKHSLGLSHRIDEVLNNLPFLKGLPKPVFDALLASGTLIKCTSGETIWTPPRPAAATARGGSRAEGGDPCPGSGIYIVIAGLVRSSYVTASGHTQEYFMGRGGVFGLLSSLAGESLPGSGPCVAVGNALMQGPVLFHFPQSLVTAVQQRAAAGDSHLRQLELDLYRVAALYLVERLKSEVMAAAATHFQALAVGQARSRTIKRLARNPPGHRQPMHVHDVWAKVGHTAKAHDVMSAELEAALEAPLAMHLGGETEKGRDSKEHSDDKLRETCNIHDDMSGLHQNGPGRNGPTDLEVVSSLEARKVWKHIRKHAAQALAELKQGMRDAELVQLAPGEMHIQQSSWVLLKGTLRITGHAAFVPAGMPVRREARSGEAAASTSAEDIERSQQGDLEVAVQYSGPAVLPWLWQPVEVDGDVVLSRLYVFEGCGAVCAGAVLLVCRTEEKDSSDSETRSEGSSVEPTPDSPTQSEQPQPPARRAQERARAAVAARMRSLPGDGTGEATEHFGPIQSSTNASKRLRVISVRHIPT
ncbi:hypothetical protein COCSUDRAFT_56295 [Coccomyxa subellipsoidea C-169]|uniref:Cation/H+ exchanger transmembrane domain-containing protein n=1 Tax=Coccomyxa subellipsoidea (strain C-169) TaxID=574566 RepID=I0YTX5_COCSC|nr:hypothetical protein COCSUDRAFT_56295 [Coccomyxa subellipsoidea C-169]EIE21844.1 hypothetical protein COCSUDRAFT_56295 [Coccomyxa subellipsoidea C-169]|eukprot:XP_005646388.1 hypothetical protein COCSUDRAFT_56295 [Coccomyxa subellipsoidea C-169]